MAKLTHPPKVRTCCGAMLEPMNIDPKSSWALLDWAFSPLPRSPCPNCGGDVAGMEFSELPVPEEGDPPTEKPGAADVMEVPNVGLVKCGWRTLST
jgi:hypothetical protein